MNGQKQTSGENVSRETNTAGEKVESGFSMQTKQMEKQEESSRDEINRRADLNNDGKATFKELYSMFRENGLPRLDSFYNALFITAQNRIANNRKIKQKYKNLYKHPKGWFGKDNEGISAKSIWDFVLGILLFVPVLVMKLSHLPKHLKRKSANISEFFDNAVSLGTVVKKYAFAVIMLVFALGVGRYMVSAANTTAVLELYIDGNRIGYVKDPEFYYAALDSAEENLSDMLGISYKIPNGTTTYKVSAVKKPTYLSETEITAALMKSSEKYLSTGYGLYIDNTLVAVSGSRLIMDEILGETQILYNQLYSDVKHQNKLLSFSNKIRIDEIIVPKTVIKSKQEIREILGLDSLSELSDLLLRDNTTDVSLMLPELESITSKDLSDELPEDTVYFVDSTDNDAASNSDSADDSHVLPGSDMDKEDATAVLTFKTTQTKTFTEVIPCEVVYTYDNNVLAGRRIVASAGVDGIRRATYEISYVDDVEIGRELISEKIIKNPVTKRVKIGTRQASEFDKETSVTGTFIMPYNGYITSNFSGRTLFGAYEFHAALDISGPLGSPIVASDGGEVVFAGENGTYGNCVIIDHGDGIQTLYAHLNAFAVEVGDKVGQGWVIGEMGRTGRVTGVHVHFEVRINGVKQDPLEYINR